MSELDEKLSAILGNQEMMGQIMTLARSLSGEQESEAFQEDPEPPTKADVSSLLSVLDPELVHSGMELVGQFQGKPDRTIALLQALRPFLREERQRKLDQALKLAPMLRMFRLVMETTQRKGDNGDV